MNRIDLPARPRILVVALRRLGDVLLTTPLIRSLRRAWPDATIDALVFADTAGILEGNPDLNGVVAMPPRPTMGQGLALAARLWKRYDLAVSTQCGDRPTFFASIAGRVRVGPFEPNLTGRLKRLAYRRSVPYAAGVHRVEEILRLADLLGIARVPELVCPSAPALDGIPHRRLCGHPCRADVSLQAMDQERLARTGGGAGRARPVGDRDRRAGAERARISRRCVVVAVRRCVASMASSIGRSLRGCWQRRASISAPIRR